MELTAVYDSEGALRFGQEPSSPHIIDGTIDPVIAPNALAFGVPDPSTDLRSVTFSRTGDALSIRIVVEDASWTLPAAIPTYKQFLVHFESDTHERILVMVEFEQNAWRAVLFCLHQGIFACRHTLMLPTWDLDSDALTVTAPLDVIQGRVLKPIAFAHAEYLVGTHPLVSFQDEAPDQPIVGDPTYGRDFDPYA